MQIQELSADSRVWQAIVAAQQATTGARDSGLHLSQITNDIALTVYPKDFAYLSRPTVDDEAAFDERTRAMFEVANVIEDMIALTLTTRLGWTKPKARCSVEGIWCSPDGFNDKTCTIDEMKATWKSSKDFLQTTKWQLYLWQVLSYMHVFGATRARIHVLHMNGDWRPPRPEPPKTYIVRPTAAEIRDNWKMITQHAKDRGWLRRQKPKN